MGVSCSAALPLLKRLHNDLFFTEGMLSFCGDLVVFMTLACHQNDVVLVSGQSPSVFKQLCGSLEGKTAWDFMLEVLNDPMYDCITM